MKSNEGFSLAATLITLTVLALLIAISWKLWDANKTAQDGVHNQSTGTSTDDDKVEATAKSYCELQKDDTGSSYSFVMGTTGPDAKKVLYSSDKQFASVNVHCAPANEQGGGTGYILKKENGNWTVISVGTQPNPNDAKKYNIPTDFN